MAVSQATKVFSDREGRPLEGAAHAAEGDQRPLIDSKIGSLVHVVARQELQVAKTGCPQEPGACHMRLQNETRGNVSYAIYHCPGASEACGRLTLAAAQRCDARLNEITGKIDALLEAEAQKGNESGQSE